MMNEEWRPVVGYEGLYEVSSLGQVKAVRRQGTDGRILAHRIDRKGYKVFSLCKNSRYATASAHRLVATAFIENPNNYPCVNHKDENKLNNHVSNLEWCTYQYNNNYGTARQRAIVARYKPCVGVWPDGTKKTFESCTLASRATGIAQGNIWGACNGLWSKAGGVVWNYV